MPRRLHFWRFYTYTMTAEMLLPLLTSETLIAGIKEPLHASLSHSQLLTLHSHMLRTSRYGLLNTQLLISQLLLQMKPISCMRRLECCSACLITVICRSVGSS